MLFFMPFLTFSLGGTITLDPEAKCGNVWNLLIKLRGGGVHALFAALFDLPAGCGTSRSEVEQCLDPQCLHFRYDV